MVSSSRTKATSSDDADGTGDFSEEQSENQVTNTGDGCLEDPSFNTLDWRDFRAKLVARQRRDTAQEELDSALESSDKDKLEELSTTFEARYNMMSHEPDGRPDCWAHQLHTPEVGCVLISRESSRKYNYRSTSSFYQAVILVTKHDEQGSMGVFLNKLDGLKVGQQCKYKCDPTLSRKQFEKLLAVDGSDEAAEPTKKQKECSERHYGFVKLEKELLYTGGPVQPEWLTALTTRPCGDSRRITKGVHMANLDDVLLSVAREDLEPHELRLLTGYFGWNEGELAKDIADGKWHVASVSSTIINDVPKGQREGNSLWLRLHDMLGIKVSEFYRKTNYLE